MTKQDELNKVATEIQHCVICKLGKTGKAVSGEGNPDADIIFVGEAPGRTEAETGRPFVGRSGKLLRGLIRDIKLDEQNVYITSPVKYLPIHGTPTISDIKHGMTHLNKQLAIINPRIIVLLGSVASRGVLEEKHKIIKEHGSVLARNGKKYFITLHPSAALRFPKYREILKHDFELIGKTVKHVVTN